jgi:transposase
MKAYSIDLREKIVDSVRKGVCKSETARGFGVDRPTAKRYVKQLDESGSLAPKKRPSSRPKLDESAMRLLKEDVEARLGHPPAEKRIPRGGSRGRGKRSNGWPGNQVPGREPKKRSTAPSEGDEWLRLLWQTEVGTLDPRRLVFVDEMGTHTSLAPLYGYSPRGQRVFFEVPRNGSKNTTLLSGIGSDGMGPSMAVEGPTTKELFGSYLEHFLDPALSAGEVIIMDNLAAHKGEKVRRIVEERGCELLYPPPYSPVLNPTEVAFSEIKRFPRRSPHQRGAGGGNRRGARCGQCERCGGLFRSLRLPLGWRSNREMRCTVRFGRIYGDLIPIPDNGGGLSSDCFLAGWRQTIERFAHPLPPAQPLHPLSVGAELP